MKPDGTAAHADSIRFFPLLPDSSARSGFPSGIRGKIRTVFARSGFPSGIRGKIRTVFKVFHFHPFC